MFVLDEHVSSPSYQQHPQSSSSGTSGATSTTTSLPSMSEFLTQPRAPLAPSNVYNNPTGPIVYGISGPYRYIPDTPASPSTDEDDDYNITNL